MARKRGLFFRPIFTFLSDRPTRKKRRSPKRSSAIQRLFLIGSGLVAIAFLLSLELPGFASVPVTPGIEPTTQTRSHSSLAAAQPSDPTTAEKLAQQARADYAAGRFSEAATGFDRAAVLYRQAGDLTQAAATQVNQAKALQALGLYSRSIAVLQSVLQTPEQPTPLLQNWETKIECAIRDDNGNPLWKQLNALPVTAENAVTLTAALRGLGDALQVVGDLEQSCTILQYSLQLAQTLPLPEALAPTYLSLGNLTRTQAIANLRLNNLEPEPAIRQLQNSPGLSPVQRELQRRRTEAAQQFMDQTAAALDYYQQAEQADRQTGQSSTPLIQVQAQLNALSLRLDRQEWSAAAAAVAVLDPLLDQLSPSRSAIEARINLAQSLVRIAEQSDRSAIPHNSDWMRQAAQHLAAAQRQASDLAIAQTESYALGSLGGLYKRTKQWPEAKALTQQALEKVNAVSVTNLPHTVSDADLAYRWYRQLGQILHEQGDQAEAIAAYDTAVQVLKERLRLDVASSNLNYQFSFREEAQEPVHRELMDLLLQADNPMQEALQRVREVSTSLLETQLTSFLQEPCTITTPEQIDQIVQQESQRTAVFYPVVLPDRLEVVVKLPNEPNLLHYRHVIPRQDLLERLSQLQLALEEDYTFEAVESLAQDFYRWLVQPAEAQLAAKQVNTLVFTLDRQLQAIPMAALHDGETYLINRYAISEILGLRFDGSVEPLQPDALKIMAAGLSEIPPSLPPEVSNNFQPLANVGDELEAIRRLKNDGIQVETLLNQEFTLRSFNTRLNETRFPVVHLATHGQFSVDPQRTFLLTSGQGRTALIEVNELASLFRTRGQIRLDSIELLVLNACETAAGDDLATLGIAGTAVRAGARSAIASLWTLDDTPSVDFTRILYQQLRQPDVTKAEALRRAQRALMQDPRYRHPRYWSPYILAGNWLPLTASRSAGAVASSPSS